MINSLTVIEKLRPKLIERVLEMRASGASYDAISRMVFAESGVEIGREGVRQFILSREKAAAE
jgi:intein-encoded DNA endonuclease-like protein